MSIGVHFHCSGVKSQLNQSEIRQIFLEEIQHREHPFLFEGRQGRTFRSVSFICSNLSISSCTTLSAREDSVWAYSAFTCIATIASRLPGFRFEVCCNFRCRWTPLSRAVIAFCTACYSNRRTIIDRSIVTLLSSTYSLLLHDFAVLRQRFENLRFNSRHLSK